MRLAEARTTRVLRDLELLGNLSNRSNYTYAGEDVDRIFKAVTQKMKEAENRFRFSLQTKRVNEFKLND